jgi:hypothetical protein
MSSSSPFQIDLINQATGDVYPVKDARMQADMYGTRVQVETRLSSQHFKNTDPGEMKLRVKEGAKAHHLPLSNWEVRSDFASDMVTISATGTFDGSGVPLVPGTGGFSEPYIEPYINYEIRSNFEWQQSKIDIPPGMTIEEAHQILTTCIVCEKPAPGMCEVCLEAVREARKLMVARWLMEMKEYESAESG